MCVQIFHMVNIDVPAGVGAPPLETQLQNVSRIARDTDSPFSLPSFFVCSI